MTAIYSDSDKFNNYRYGVEAKLIPKDGEEEDTIFLTEGVTELRIFKHFDQQVMPYYRLTVAISVNTATDIQNAWRTGKLYITIKKFRALKGETTDDLRMENTDEDYLKNGEFRVMVCDGAPPHVPVGQSNDLVRQVPSVQFMMELAPVIPLDINKNILNSAFHEVTVGEMVALSASDSISDEHSDYKFVMSPSDNPKRYESVFIPPQNFVPTVRHIDSVYGLYSGKLALFLDVDRGYILSSTKATAGGPKEPLSVILEVMSPEDASPDRMATGSAYDRETRLFRVRTAQRIAAAVDGPANREVDGESVKLVRSTTDERSGSNCKSLTTDDNPPEGKKKERVAWQCYDNPLTAERMKIEAREKFAPASVSFSSCDLGAFAPNLQWTLVTEATRTEPMEGQWRIRASEFILTKAPGVSDPCSVEVMAEIVPAVSADPASAEAARDKAKPKAATAAPVPPETKPPEATVSAEASMPVVAPAAEPASPKAVVTVEPLPTASASADSSAAVNAERVKLATQQNNAYADAVESNDVKIEAALYKARQTGDPEVKKSLRQDVAYLRADNDKLEQRIYENQQTIIKYTPSR
jgi:hypothetical protein